MKARSSASSTTNQTNGRKTASVSAVVDPEGNLLTAAPPEAASSASRESRIVNRESQEVAAQGDLFGLPPDAPQPAPTDAPAGAGDSRFAIHDSPVAGKAGYDAQRRRQIALYAADRAGDLNFANKGILIGQIETFFTGFLNARMKGLSRTAARAKEAPGEFTLKALAALLNRSGLDTGMPGVGLPDKGGRSRGTRSTTKRRMGQSQRTQSIWAGVVFGGAGCLAPCQGNWGRCPRPPKTFALPPIRLSRFPHQRPIHRVSAAESPRDGGRSTECQRLSLREMAADPPSVSG